MLAVGTYALKEKRLAEYVKAQEDLQATSSDQVLARSDERRPQSDGVDLVHAAEALRDSADAAGCDDDLIVVESAALVSILEADGVEHRNELSNGGDETARRPGRAWGRERVGEDGGITVVAGSLKK